jgi:hypothetical protein
VGYWLNGSAFRLSAFPKSGISSKTVLKAASGVRHIVRYVFRKGSQLESHPRRA